jgi:hypothetical protein
MYMAQLIIILTIDIKLIREGKQRRTDFYILLVSVPKSITKTRRRRQNGRAGRMNGQA